MLIKMRSWIIATDETGKADEVLSLDDLIKTK